MRRLVTVLVLLYSIQVASAQKVRVDFDHACNFSQYRTYSWSGPPDVDGFNQLMQERLKGFVEEYLAAKGLKRVAANGDLLISCQVNTREEERYITYTNGFGGWGWGWDGGGGISTTTAVPILLGTVTLDVVDAHRNRLIFQGTATSSVSSRPARNTRTFAKSVRKIMEKYPPK
jgi:Domain of unknown function (DUF4136)